MRTLYIVLIVYGLAFLYTFALSLFLARFKKSETSNKVPFRDRLSLSLICAVVFLGVINNYLTFLLGAYWAGYVLILIPVSVIFWLGREFSSSVWADFRPDWKLRLQAAFFTVLTILLIAGNYFFRGPLSEFIIWPKSDFTFRLGRVAQQAFLTYQGHFVLSPVAFPAPLPANAFVGDSLAGLVLRYIPIEIQPMDYVQAIFLWASVLWIATVWMLRPSKISSLLFLVISLFVTPWLFGGTDRIVSYLATIFTNANSAMAYPIGLALTYHLYRALTEKYPPSLWALFFIPPLSMMFKTPLAPAFLFLQMGGLLILTKHKGGNQFIPTIKLIAICFCLWRASSAALFSMGGPLISTDLMMPSWSNFLSYCGSSGADMGHGRVYPALVFLLLTVLFVVRINLGESHTPLIEKISRHLLFPYALFLAAFIYVLSSWFIVVWEDDYEVMLEILQLTHWIATVILFHEIDCMYRNRSFQLLPMGYTKITVSPLVLFVVLSASIAVLWGPIREKNLQASERGRLIVEKIRSELKQEIPNGNCFSYGKFYTIFVHAPVSLIDWVGPITGCPLINGIRFRGIAGVNDPEKLKLQQTISLSADQKYKVVKYKMSEEVISLIKKIPY